MAIAARNDQPVSFQAWTIITATPKDFRLDAGAYGLTVHATAWGTATLQRVLPDGSGGQIPVTIITAFAADAYTEMHLPAGWYRLVLAGVTAFTGEIAQIAPGSG